MNPITKKCIIVLFSVTFFIGSFHVSALLFPTMRDLRYPMFAAARDGNLERVKFLSSFGMINQRSCDLKNCGLSAVEIATINGHKEVVDFLIAKGAQAPKVKSRNKKSP